MTKDLLRPVTAYKLVTHRNHLSGKYFAEYPEMEIIEHGDTREEAIQNATRTLHEALELPTKGGETSD